MILLLSVVKCLVIKEILYILLLQDLGMNEPAELSSASMRVENVILNEDDVTLVFGDEYGSSSRN